MSINQKRELDLEPQRLVDFELDLNTKSIAQRARRKSSTNYFEEILLILQKFYNFQKMADP